MPSDSSARVAQGGWTGSRPSGWWSTGIFSVQFGAAIAKHLFPLVPPTAMVWLRLATSSVIFLLSARPRVRGRTRTDWLVALAFGVSLVTMNWAIYQSFARIPLGVAVTIEFLGPLTVAVVGSRRLRDLIWVLLAGRRSRAARPLTGVPERRRRAVRAARRRGLGRLHPDERTDRPPLARVAGADGGQPGRRRFCWPRRRSSQPAASLLQPEVLLFGVAVGLLSSVIPYSLELNALRRIPPRLFGILMSLEPAAAALAAMVLLREFLSWTQWLALVCVVSASVGATRSNRAPAEPTAI